MLIFKRNVHSKNSDLFLNQEVKKSRYPLNVTDIREDICSYKVASLRKAIRYLFVFYQRTFFKNLIRQIGSQVKSKVADFSVFSQQLFSYFQPQCGRGSYPAGPILKFFRAFSNLLPNLIKPIIRKCENMKKKSLDSTHGLR